MTVIVLPEVMPLSEFLIVLSRSVVLKKEVWDRTQITRHFQ